jgi:AcrR family transcriptional regulator
MNKLKEKLKPRKEAVQERAKHTVDSILTAAAHILEKTGLDQLNTNQIAEKAGVSIGSLYQYFPSKESIFHQLVEKDLEKKYAEFTEDVFQKDYQNLNDFISVAINKLMDIFEERRPLRLLLFKYLPRGLTPAIHKVEDKFSDSLSQKLASFDEMKKHDDIELKAYMLTHLSIGIIHSSLAKGRKYDKEVMRKELHHIIMSYLN